MIKNIKEYIKKSSDTKIKIYEDKNILEQIGKACENIIHALKSGNKILLAGNGGSASDSNHIAGEFVSGLYKARKALNALSLTSNNSIITAISNDYGYDKVFSRQIEAIGNKGDVLIALTTSGNSKNIVEALKTAQNLSVLTICMTGINNCEADKYANILIKVPSDDTPIIQESQITIGHLICKIIEENI